MRKLMEWPRLSELDKQTRRYDNDWLTVVAMPTIRIEDWRST